MYCHTKSRLRGVTAVSYSLAGLLLMLIAACNKDAPVVTELFPVRVNNQYGFMDRNAKMMIAPQYSQAGCFVDGLALAGTMSEKIKWGFIDKTGKYFIYPSYIDASSFSEGIAFVVPENGEPVAMDKTGAVKFTVKNAEQVQSFSDGLAAFSILTENGERWGFIDKEGTVKIQPAFAATGFFSSSLCPVVNDEGKWGYINKEGTTVIECRYDNVSPFYDKVAKVCVDDKWGVIDNKGNFIITPQYSNIDIDRNKFLVAQNDKFGWLDETGKKILDFRFADAFPFNESKYAPVRYGDKWGYIDLVGNFSVNPQYDFAFGFDGDRAPVRINGKLAFIDYTGKMIADPYADDISMDYYLRSFAKTSAFSGVTTNNNTPKFVGYRWLIKFYHLQFEEAKFVSTDDTKTLLTQFESLSSLMPDSSKQEMKKIMVGIKDYNSNDSNAVISYTTSDNPDKLQTLYLIKKEEKWLVQFSKNDAMQGSAEDTGNNDNNDDK